MSIAPSLPMRHSDCRGCPLHEEQVAARATRFEHAGMVLEPARERITWRGAAVYVTPIEARLLGKLFRAAGATVTFDAMRLAMHGDDPDGGPTDHSLKVHISNIRRRLIQGHGLPFEIRTQHAVGYAAVLA